MVELFKNILFYWNDEKNQRSKLQQAYFAVVILLAVVAGVITLFSPAIGQHVMIVAAGFAAVYIVNAIAWTLLEGVIIRKISTLRRTDRRKK